MTNQSKKFDSVWDFVEAYYPNYHSSQQIADANDLELIVSGEEIDESSGAYELLNTRYGGDRNSAYPDRDEVMLSVYESAIQGYIEQPDAYIEKPDAYTIFLMAQIIQISKPDLEYDLLWDEATRNAHGFIQSPLANVDMPLLELVTIYLDDQGYKIPISVEAHSDGGTYQMNDPKIAGIVNSTIASLKSIDIDGETTEYIINEIGMREQMQKQLNPIPEEREPTYVLFGDDLVRFVDQCNADAEKIAEKIHDDIGGVKVFEPDASAGSIVESTIGWGDYLIIHGAQYREIKRHLDRLSTPPEPETEHIYMTTTEEMSLRMGLINRDADNIREFLMAQGLFDEDSEVWKYLNNIKIATDLSDPECLSWA